MWELLQGKCEDRLADLAENSLDSCVTDPPYELGFMGKRWDASGIAYSVDMWREVYRVLKPGAYLLAFGGTRTYHRMAVAIEDAGFLVRDSIHWLYSTGFPKSLQVTEALKKANAVCTCEGSTLPYDHDERKALPEYDVRPVWQADLSAAVNVADQRGQILFAGVPQHGASVGVQQLPNHAGREESRMEGRRNLLAQEGQLQADQVRSSAGMGETDGATGRLHHGASPRDGADVRAAARTRRGGASPRSRSSQQPSEQPRIVADQQQPQVSGAWPHCGRCGLPIIPPLSTALKPAHEPIIVAQKPLSGTYAANVLAWGCGAMNIDGCRVGEGNGKPKPEYVPNHANAVNGVGMGGGAWENTSGRWPANLVLTHSAGCGDECAPGCPVATLDAQSGIRTSGASAGFSGAMVESVAMGRKRSQINPATVYADSGGASRFYPTFRYGDDDLAPFLYCAKPGKAERNAGLAGLRVATAGEMTSRKEGSAGLNSPRAGAGRTEGGANVHPTVKPLALMRWLVRLVTPHGGTVLDPFAGSGTTIAAALREGKRAIGIEMTPDYWPIIAGRAAYHAEIAGREAAEARQLPIAVPADDADDWADAPQGDGPGRCFTCRTWGEHERDAVTRELVCAICAGDKHRRHHAAYCERNAMEVF